MDFTTFRILADVSHTLSKITLIWAIFRNRSAEGVSLLTQFLYIFVFCSRYLDIFWTSPAGDAEHVWVFVLKIFYVSSSFFIVYLMMRVFVRTREREAAWKLSTYCLVGSLLSAPLITLAYLNDWTGGYTFEKFLKTFSKILESVCVLPQLLLLRQTSVPTVIDSYYLLTLGAYRFLYVLNWIQRGVEARYIDPVSVVFGVIQTLFYFDFAWVYYSRQRVKLRYGGVVDDEDFSKGFLVNRVLRTTSQNDGDDEEGLLEDQENGTIRPSGTAGRNWGPRGISVSADDDLEEYEAQGASEIADPSAFEVADDEAEYEDEAPPPPAKDVQPKQQENDGVESSANEWSDERGRDV